MKNYKMKSGICSNAESFNIWNCLLGFLVLHIFCVKISSVRTEFIESMWVLIGNFY
jgi:hypothetical protein